MSAQEGLTGQFITDTDVIRGGPFFEDRLLDALAVIRPSSARTLDRAFKELKVIGRRGDHRGDGQDVDRGSAASWPPAGPRAARASRSCWTWRPGLTAARRAAGRGQAGASRHATAAAGAGRRPSSSRRQRMAAPPTAPQRPATATAERSARHGRCGGRTGRAPAADRLGAGRRPSRAAAAAVLRGAGWHVTTIDASTPLPIAWQRLPRAAEMLVATGTTIYPREHGERTARMNVRIGVTAAMAVLLASLSLNAVLQGNGWLAAGFGAVIVIAGAGLADQAVEPARQRWRRRAVVLIGVVPLLSAPTWPVRITGLVIVALTAASATGWRVLRAFRDPGRLSGGAADLPEPRVRQRGLVRADHPELSLGSGTGPDGAERLRRVQVLTAGTRYPAGQPGGGGRHRPDRDHRGHRGGTAAAARRRRRAAAGAVQRAGREQPEDVRRRCRRSRSRAALAGFLALLSADGRMRLRMWGRLVTFRYVQPADEAGAGPDTRELAASGRRIGLAAVCLAVIIPIILPAVHARDVFGTTDNGKPQGVGAGLDAFLRVQHDLIEHPQPVLSYTTDADDPAQQYFQVYALNYSTARNAWFPEFPARRGRVAARASATALPYSRAGAAARPRRSRTVTDDCPDGAGSGRSHRLPAGAVRPVATEDRRCRLAGAGRIADDPQPGAGPVRPGVHGHEPRGRSDARPTSTTPNGQFVPGSIQTAVRQLRRPGRRQAAGHHASSTLRAR